MNNLNPNAVAFWICLTGVGYLIGQSFSQGVNGAVTGLVIATGISFLVK